MERFVGTLYDDSGNKVDGVTVTVKIAGTATLAALYADDGITTKANPYTNDSDGSYEHYTPNRRVDTTFAKTGLTLVADNSADLIVFDPRDDAAAVMFKCDFFSADDRAAGQLISDGHHFATAGGTASVTGDTTYRGGWIDVIESGGVAGALTLANTADTLQLLFVPTTDTLWLEMRIEKIGDAVAGTRRCGLGSAAMSAGDPANGIYIRQIDAANAFLVCRAATVETTTDLGQTLNAPTKIRVTITTTSVRVFVDGVAKTPATTNIPTAIMGLSAGGGATASGGGLRLDYLNVMREVRT
jgi:hypothetical protein